MPQFIIGRQEGTHKLQISGQNGFVDAVDTIGSVDDSVSRKHVRLDVDAQSGEMSLTNLNENNRTVVNGVEIITKNVQLNDTILLGANGYQLNLKMVWDALPRTGAASVKDELSIAHLEPVWNTYSDTKRNYQVRQGRIRAIQGLSIVFTMGSAIAGFLMGSDDSHTLQFVCYGMAVIFALVLAVVNWRSASKGLEVSEKNDEYLRDRYICPNKNCGKFLGYTKYRDLIRTGRCSHCGTKFML